MSRVGSVTVFQNGMVAVFDQNGQQMPELQGRWREKANEILPHITETTELYVMDYRAGVAHSVSRTRLWLVGEAMDKDDLP